MIQTIKTERELFSFLSRLAGESEPKGAYLTSYVSFVNQALALLTTFPNNSERLLFAEAGLCCPTCGHACGISLVDLIHQFSSCHPRTVYSRALAFFGIEILGRLEEGITLPLAVKILVDALRLTERGLLIAFGKSGEHFRTTSAGEEQLGVKISVFRTPS